MVEKEYICVCGKTFNNPQSFNGHKCHCKEHYIQKYGSENKYYEILNNQITYIRKGSVSRSDRNKQKKQQELKQWISEKHACEKCGKIMNEKFRSGRFCCISCANSHKHSEETKQKISKGIKVFIKNKNRTETCLYDIPSVRYCLNCGNKISKNNKTGYCINCYRNSPIMKDIVKIAGKKSIETRRKNGTISGWQSRNITSYPENFWINVLDSNKISYIREFKVNHTKYSNYFLDFYIEKNGYKIDLEIDGKQHGYIERVELDKIRDEYLTSLGYIVYRIRWNGINSEDGKLKMQEKIKKFIDYYNSL